MLWTHDKFSDLTLGYKPENTGKLKKESVKQIVDNCRILNERLAISVPEIVAIQLPTQLAVTTRAIRENNVATFYHETFREFQISFKSADLSDEGLVKLGETFERQFQPTLDRLSQMQTDYGVTITHQESNVTLAQPLAGIEKTVDFLDDFATDLLTALNEIEDEAEDYKLEREVAFHDLARRGYEVREATNELIITDPRRTELAPLSVKTDFSVLISNETTLSLKKLESRYSLQKPVTAPAVPVSPKPVPIAAPNATPVAATPVASLPPTAAQPIAKPTPPIAEPAPVAPVSVAVPPVRVPKLSSEFQTSIAAEPANILQEPPVSDIVQPASDNNKDRPGTAIIARTSKPGALPIDQVLYDLMVRLRNERGMTEQDFVDGIKQVAAAKKRKQVVFTGDLIDDWQRNKSFPKNREQWDMVCQVLILENQVIPEGGKQQEITKYGYARDESHALLYNTPDKVKSEDFGIFTSRYRRQLGHTEEALAVIFTERYAAIYSENEPAENIDALDFNDIARIQIGAQKASPGLIKYMICALNNDFGIAKVPVVLSGEDTATLQERLEKVPASGGAIAATPSKKNDAEEIQVTPEAKQLRAELFAMFKDKDGKQLSAGKLIYLGREIHPSFNAMNTINYLTEKTDTYYPLSLEKAAKIKSVMIQILQNTGANELNLKEFGQRFDQLTQIYMDWKQERAQHISPGRPKAAGVSQPIQD